MAREDELFTAQNIPGVIQAVYGEEHEAYDDAGFYGYLYSIAKNNPGSLHGLATSPDSRELFDALYARFQSGRETTYQALREDIRDDRNMGPALSRSALMSMAGDTEDNISYEDQQGMSYDHARGGTFEQLEKEKRELYIKKNDGTYRLLEGQHRKDNGQFWRDEGSEADRWPQIRREIINQSWNSDPIDTSPVQAYVPLSFRGTNSDFIAPTPNGPRPMQARIPKGQAGGGRYASAPSINFEFKERDAMTAQVGEHIREQIAYNYVHSTIHQDTGTLLRAIEEANIKVTVDEDGKGLLVVVTLADIPRPPQPGQERSEPVTTEQYGSWVFRGRRGFSAQKSEYLRFNSGEHGYSSGHEFGNWHTTRNVMPSDPHPEVFTLTHENMSQLYKDIQYMVQNAVSVQNSPKGGA